PPEQSLLLTEAWSWASKKKQPHLFSGVIVGGHLWLLGFSPGAGGFCTTLPPSFLRVDDRATSSTTDSSRAPSSPRPPGSTSHCGISTGCTERCLCVLPLRTSQVPDVMAPQHDQEKFHDLAYSCLGKSFSMSNQDLYGYSTSLALGLAWLSWETKKKNVLHLVGLDSL
ncbi:LOW QUALITY PROTEIN: C1orf61 isoform 17, partial [Pan troglodytes]